MAMDITWDDRKAEANLKKHGISFEEAATVVLNPLSLVAPNDHSSHKRYEYLGHSTLGRVLYIVTIERNDSEIRIISARKATAHEKVRYEEGI